MAGIQFSPTCCCGGVCEICAHVEYTCSGDPVDGAMVTAYDADDEVAGTCITDSNGDCCISIDESGGYEVKPTKSGLTGGFVAVDVDCPETESVTIVMQADFDLSLFGGRGCNLDPLVGERITIDGASYVLDEFGQVYYPTGPGNLPWSFAADRLVPQSGVEPHFCGYNEWGIDLEPQEGYACINFAGNTVGPTQCPYPFPVELNLTDSIVGSCTLTYDPGDLTWKGEITYSFPGYCFCPAKTVIVRYFLSVDGSISVAYSFRLGCPSSDPGYSFVAADSFYATLIQMECYPGGIFQTDFSGCEDCQPFFGCVNGIYLYGNSVATITVTE